MSHSKKIAPEEELTEGIIEGLSLLDDDFFTESMDNNPEMVQHILNIIREVYPFPEVKIKSVRSNLTIKDTVERKDQENQSDSDNSQENKSDSSSENTKQKLTGHDVELDLLVTGEFYDEDEDKSRIVYIDIEVQNYSEKGIALRVRYYGDMMDLYSFRSGTKYYDLPEQYIIFISKKNLFKTKYAFDYVDQTLHYTQTKFNDRRNILMLTEDPQEKNSKFDKIKELVKNLGQTNPNLITDKVIQDLFVKKKEDFMNDNAMYKKYYGLAEKIINRYDPDGSLSRAQRDEAIEERDEAIEERDEAIEERDEAIAREKVLREEFENYKVEMEAKLAAAQKNNPQPTPAS